MKKIIFVVSLLAVLFLLLGCTSETPVNNSNTAANTDVNTQPNNSNGNSLTDTTADTTANPTSQFDSALVGDWKKTVSQEGINASVTYSFSQNGGLQVLSSYTGGLSALTTCTCAIQSISKVSCENCSMQITNASEVDLNQLETTYSSDEFSNKVSTVERNSDGILVSFKPEYILYALDYTISSNVLTISGNFMSGRLETADYTKQN